MPEPPNHNPFSEDPLLGWDFEWTRRQHLRIGLKMSPAERLRWLEETVEEMRSLQGLAKLGRPIKQKP